jgi:hypothetical protein
MTTSPDTLRLLASVFTRPAFAAMARTEDYRAPFAALFKAGIVREQETLSQPLVSLFEDAAGHLARKYRNEYVYKNDLASRLIFGRHSPRTAGLQLELPVGRSIVDVAVANGTSTAYEIKTEFDTTRRLNSQTSDYLKAFDRVFVVTHPAHAKRFEKELDSRVGVIVLSASGAMKTLRDATSNSHNVEPGVIFRCLRRAEYVSAIAKLFGSVPSLPNGLIRAHCEKLFANISATEAHRAFVETLRARTTDQNTVEFVSQLPASLRALGYATPLSGRQRKALLILLQQKVGLTLAI